MGPSAAFCAPEESKRAFRRGPPPRRWGVASLFVGSWLGAWGCSEGQPGDAPSNPASGGAASVSGGAASGGQPNPSSGGAASSGGALGSGGGPSSGGAPAAAGGALGSGGASSGGAAAGSGGDAAGGASGGAAAGGTGGQASDDLCDSGVFDGEVPAPLALSGETLAHDPTMIRVGDTYYRFWTGDYIPSATSKDLKNWSRGPNVYSAYPDWSKTWLAGISGQTFNFPWAPDVVSFGGKVHLYSSFSAKFGANISCITHLSTSDIGAGNWTDHGPVICTNGSEKYNAIDADVGFDAEGRGYLAFGSFWDGIFAFELNEDGSRRGNDLVRLAHASQIEAPVLFRRCGYHYLFVTWGLCCPGEGRSVNQLSYRVAVGRSENILGPYLDKTGKPLLEGGGTLVVEGDKVNWAAAGHSDVLVVGDTIYHTYHAYRRSNGAAVLRITPLVFDEDGWPLPHAP